MTPLQQVQALLLASDRSKRRDVARACCAPDVIFHDGFDDLIGEAFVAPIIEPFVDVHFLDGFADVGGGAVVFNARDSVTDLWYRCAWVFHHRDGRITEIFANNQIVPPPALKTIVLAPLQSATTDLANILKAEFGWLNPVSDVLRMLKESRPVNVVEHVKPQHVAGFTSKLDALGLAYSVVDEQ